MLLPTTKHFDRADLKPSDRLTEQTPSDSTMRLLSVYSRRQAPFKGPLQYLFRPLLGKNEFAVTRHMYAFIGPNLDNIH